MRFIELKDRTISLTLHRRDRFWVEEEGYDIDTGEYYYITYEIPSLSWKNFKKKVLKDEWINHGRFIRL